MILIKPDIYNLIESYVHYLVKEGITSQERAFEKKKFMIESLHSSLGGILTHRSSPYCGLGKNEGCLLYVYRDFKSKTQWGFAYKRFEDNNVIVYYMKNLKLLKEDKYLKVILDSSGM